VNEQVISVTRKTSVSPVTANKSITDMLVLDYVIETSCRIPMWDGGDVRIDVTSEKT
jgi:hypothetical protein